MIGDSVLRREDPRLLTGQGRYTDDLHHPGRVYAAFCRSPHAHAAIESIGVDAARAMPGVLGVFTGTDLRDGGVHPIPALLGERSGGANNRDGSIIREPIWWPLAIERVRHIGEPVAVVIAISPNAALDAVEAIEVAYRPRNVVIDWNVGNVADVELAFETRSVSKAPAKVARWRRRPR